MRGCLRTAKTDFSSVEILKLMKLQCRFRMAVGNEKRIKIWNEEGSLLCDLNINVLTI